MKLSRASLILDMLMILCCVFSIVQGEDVSPWLLLCWVTIALIHDFRDYKEDR